MRQPPEDTSAARYKHRQGAYRIVPGAQKLAGGVVEQDQSVPLGLRPQSLGEAQKEVPDHPPQSRRRAVNGAHQPHNGGDGRYDGHPQPPLVIGSQTVRRPWIGTVAIKTAWGVTVKTNNSYKDVVKTVQVASYTSSTI